MAEETSTPPKSALRVIGELGPAWITSITGIIAVLATAGFFVGHATAGANAVPQPTATAKATATVTKTIYPGAAARPSAAPATAVSGTADASNVSSAGLPANGTLLGSYSIDLSAWYSAPLGPAQPTQAQFTQTSSGGDVYYNSASYSAGRDSERVVSLPTGIAPTYKACSTGTTFTQNVTDTVGASFCVLEADGKTAGVYVSADESGYAVLQVSVWQSAS